MSQSSEFTAEPLTLKQLYTRKISPFEIPADDLPPALVITNYTDRAVALSRKIYDEHPELAIAGGLSGVLVSRFFGRKSLIAAGLTIGAAVAPLSYCAYKWFTTLRAPDSVQTLVAKTVAYSEDNPEFTDYDKEHVKEPGPIGRRSRRWAYLPYAIRAIKSDVGLISDCSSNRQIIRKKLYNHAIEHGIRPHHIQEFIDLGIDLVLTPSDKDVASQQTRRTGTVISRNAEFAYWGGRRAAL